MALVEVDASSKSFEDTLARQNLNLPTLPTYLLAYYLPRLQIADEMRQRSQKSNDEPWMNREDSSAAPSSHTHSKSIQSKEQ